LDNRVYIGLDEACFITAVCLLGNSQKKGCLGVGWQACPLFPLKRCWTAFVERLKDKLGKKIKVIAVPERHESGQLHFHALIGNVDIDYYLRPAVDPRREKKTYNKPLLTKYGDRIYNLKLWKHGFSTVVKIRPTDNYLQVANYLIGYTTKSGNIGYNKKRYYRTHNLEYSDKELFLFDDDMKHGIINSIFAVEHKDNDLMTVYRVFDCGDA